MLSLLIADSVFADLPIGTANFETTNDFHDLIIPIQHSEKRSDRWIITTRGKFGSTVGGFELQYKLEDMRDEPGTKEVIFNVNGKEGQVFLKELSQRYGVPYPKTAPKKEIHLYALETEGEIATIENTPLVSTFIKLTDDDSYGEWYCDIDLKKGLVRFREKNQQYREQFIKAFFE